MDKSLFQVEKNQSETFVFKLHRMVEEESRMNSRVIRWGKEGRSFLVLDSAAFTKDHLPTYFKHRNFASYVRQLNMYGFRKVNENPRGRGGLDTPQIWEFLHPKFQRGKPDLLVEIKRKISAGSKSPSDGDQEMTQSKNPADLVYFPVQHDSAQGVANLQFNFQLLLRELHESKRKQNILLEGAQKMLQVLSHHQALLNPGDHKPLDLSLFGLSELENPPLRNDDPSTFISSSFPSSSFPSSPSASSSPSSSFSSSSFSSSPSSSSPSSSFSSSSFSSSSPSSSSSQPHRSSTSSLALNPTFCTHTLPSCPPPPGASSSPTSYSASSASSASPAPAPFHQEISSSSSSSSSPTSYLPPGSTFNLPFMSSGLTIASNAHPDFFVPGQVSYSFTPHELLFQNEQDDYERKMWHQ